MGVEVGEETHGCSLERWDFMGCAVRRAFPGAGALSCVMFPYKPPVRSARLFSFLLKVVLWDKVGSVTVSLC